MFQNPSIQMSNSLICVLALFASCSLAAGYQSAEPDWTYMLLKIECSSSNETIVKTDLRPVRLEPGLYAINGTFELGTDIDDEYMVEANLLYSTNSGGPWTSTPFTFKSCSFYKFMNTAYKEYMMEDLSACAGTPNFGTDQWNSPLKGRIIYAKNCLISNENLPTHLRPGFYKVVAKATGPSAYLLVELTAKVEQRQK